MKTKLLACSFLAAVTAATAETSLWKVQSGDSVLYLGGTCHVLRPTDYPLPAAFDAAYRDAALLVVEAPLDRMSDPSVQAQIMIKSVYADGSTLSSVLSPATYAMLKRHCDDVGLPLAQMDSLKPAAVAMTLVVVALRKVGVAETGVDAHFFEKAKQDGKPVEGLESVDEQISLIADMGKGKEDAFMQYMLEDMDQLPQVMNDLIGAWREGDRERMWELFVKDVKEKSPELYDDMFVKRNNAWLAKIRAYLATNDKELILVGAGHLAGPDGLLAQLEAQGFRLEPVED
ncbi:MAG TPA: TraB/GumN family protein [Kiritimatiellia bacterium]|jgi:hypothetical protein